MKFQPVFIAVAAASVASLTLVPGIGLAQRPQQERLVRFSTRGTHYAVAAGSDYATNAGSRMMETGGNAVDAGVASIFAAATTEYSHVGWGGGSPEGSRYTMWSGRRREGGHRDVVLTCSSALAAAAAPPACLAHAR